MGMPTDSATNTAVPAAVKPRFPFLDLKAQFAPMREEVMQAVTRVMESQQFILGPEVEALEKDLAAYVGCKHAIGCASGSDALLLPLMALNVGPGDEVITTPFTFVATAGAIARLHARPVFVDIDPVTFNIAPHAIERAITAKTKAIIPVHLFGLAADMKPVLEIAGRHGIHVIEDAAQAIGSKYEGRMAGAIGHFGCFSFFPSKNLGAAGDGGLVTCNDDRLAHTLRILRTHGSRTRYEYDLVGVNSRLDALQAAILRIKLRYLDGWAAARQRNAERYRKLFVEAGMDDKVKPPTAPARCEHVYNQFTIRVERRDELKRHLQQQGIPSEIYYPFPLHTQAAFAYLGYKEGGLPESEKAAREVLSLPIYPELSQQQQQWVVQGIADFYRSV